MTVKNNQLKYENSPYLLQHKENPVNWYAWGEAAFQKAKEENKPIFLSIGYSTCHWCHRMAEESFEDPEVAALLNEYYIAVKVDREERPDIDGVYMKVCQMMTGEGGWPLTIVMTPDKVPFYAGTYFPKHANYGRPGMMDMLVQLQKRFAENPDYIQEITTEVQNALKETTQKKSEKRLQTNMLDKTFQELADTFDTEFGGFGPAPKFPQSQNLQFLLDAYEYQGNKQALSMVEKTLQQIAKGGIFDQIGYGFSRYATDRGWLVPHFEKMLYDNAQLLSLFTRAYALSGKVFYRKISEQTIAFISREMISVEGTFYSAIDADSEGEEGKFYVWDYEEVLDILGEEAGEAVADFYGMTPAGNFEGKNIPHLIHHQEMPQLPTELEKGRQLLLAERETRIYPHVDDKILTSWNAMMVHALAYSGHVFKNEAYLATAFRSLSFIEEHLYDGERLKARYRSGETKFKGYLDDYAYLTQAYLTLYEATFNLELLKKAKKTAEQMIQLFWDEQEGGFFLTGIDAEKLISREKEIFDGALPSGNSIAAMVLTKLASLTGEAVFQQHVETMYQAFYEDICDYPAAGSSFIRSLFRTDFPAKEVVVIGDATDTVRQQLLDVLQQEQQPNKALLVAEHAGQFEGVAPFAAQYKRLNGQTTFYVCENFSCHQPTTDIQTALSHIRD